MKFKLIASIILISFVSLVYAQNTGLQLGKEQYFEDVGEFIISTTADENTIQINVPDMDAEKFGIYRSTEKDGLFKKIGLAKKNTYTDKKIKKGITYYYVAVALVKTEKKGKKKWKKINSNKGSAEIVIIISEVEVNFKSTPKGAVVIVNNQNIGKTPVTKKYKVGMYELTIQKEGYKTYKVFNFNIDYRPRIDVDITLEKITGSLNINTTPPGATIKLNDKEIGKSPVRKDNLELGTYTIEAALQDYKPVKKAVDINSETPVSVNVILKKEPETGHVNINSAPTGAEIFIDNIKYGKTPNLIKDLNAGMHTLILRKINYNEINKEIEIETNKTKNYNFTLVKEHGFLTITTFPDSADCYLNENLIGKTPVESVEVDKGIYNLTIKKENYSEFREMIQIDIDKHLKRDIILSMQKSTLIINTYPDKAKVMIQGMKYGLTPFISDNIQQGKIKIDIIKDGFKSISKEITLSPNSTKNLSFNLEPVEVVIPVVPTPVTPSPTVPAEEEVVIENGTLSVITTPPDAALYLNNKFHGQTPIIASLSPGTYNIKIKKNQFKTWTGSAIIASKKTEKLNIALDSMETYLTIKSAPKDVEIYLNNIFFGRTPNRFKIPAGDYVLNLKKNDYEPYSTALIITGVQKEMSEFYRLKKEIKKYYFSSKPRNAEVLLNNRIIGITPFEHLDIKDGTYNIKFHKTGYRLWEKNITIFKGEPSRITADMEALKGHLVVNSSPKTCDVYIDNKRMGVSDKMIKNIPAGYHNVKVMKYGYYDFASSIRILDNQLSFLKVELAEKPKGNIRIDSDPKGAKIYLSGQFKGVTPSLLENIPEDKYKLRLKAKKHKSFNTTVSVVGNKTEYVFAKLVPGSDCCCLSSFFSKPVFWYVTSALCAVGSGWAWYAEEQARKDKNYKQRSDLHDTRNGLAIGSGACLMIGITFDLIQ